VIQDLRSYQAMHVRLLSTVLCAAFARSVHAAATMFVHVKETQRGHRDIQSQCTRMASPLSMLSMPRLRPLQLSPDPPEDERSDSTMKDPYATLGLPPTASLAEIKATFRAIAMQTHPDSIQSKEKFGAAHPRALFHVFTRCIA
jgi:DnaJ-domain-containing protein 1